MIIGIASEKGGVGKTTTALHLAQFLQRQFGSTVLFDGDRIRIATNFDKRGRANNTPPEFDVLPVEAATGYAAHYRNRVIDTGQQPGDKDLLILAQYCDLLIVPTAPAAFDADGLGQTIRALRNITKPNGQPINFRVLFTRVEHHHAKEIRELRTMLERGVVPMFSTEIPELKAFERAAGRGVLVDAVKDDPYAEKAWEAYEAAGRELLNEPR